MILVYRKMSFLLCNDFVRYPCKNEAHSFFLLTGLAEVYHLKKKVEEIDMSKRTRQSCFPAGFPGIKPVMVCVLSLMMLPLFAQVDYFTIDVDSLFGLWMGDSDWGDVDNDNDLDLMMVGYGLGGATGQGFHKFYRNDGNSTFTLLDTGMMGVGNGSVRFADLDNDNDLDAIVSGQYLFNIDSTRVYINNNGIFTDSNANLPPRVSNSISIGDYDNDGDQDILMTGGTIAQSAVGYLEIYRNDGNFNFTQVNVMTPGIRNGHAEFGDYNNDGWLDICLAGSAGSGNYVTKILKGSSSGTFTELPLAFLGLRYSKVAWVDYDCDGDLDLLVSGSYVNESPSEFRLYRNDGNDVFTDVAQTNVLGERQGDMVWGDVNCDGYPDIILNGLITNTSTVANVYLYNPQSALFEDSQTMIYLKYACMSLGDYNNDSRLDMSLCGHYDYQDYWNELYLNSYTATNAAPGAPAGLGVTITQNDVQLHWQAATDDHTPVPGLTYNLRVGSTPGGSDIISAMAVPATGWRKLARPGNAGIRLFYLLPGLADGTYYWSVQAIDNNFAGGAFAPEQSFTLGVANNDLTSPPITGVSIYPNPFQAQTTLSFQLAKTAPVRVDVYNLKGQLVKTLQVAALTKGEHRLVWDGSGQQANPVANGLYFARIIVDNSVFTHKMILMK